MKEPPAPAVSLLQSQLALSSNTTSRDTCTRHVAGLYTLYALEPGSYPMSTMGVLRSSSFLRRGRALLTCATHPKTRRWLTSGFLPCQASYGVAPSTLR